jgi:putative spermidine/putrescine transport system ATP-binding protein
MAFLELNNLRKTFGPTVAVEHFDLHIDRGEFVSFLGPSGCGKTTTMRMVAGFEMPDTGHIKVNGQDLTNVPPNKRNVGMVFQSYALFPHLSVRDNIGFGLKIANKPKAELSARVDEMLGIIKMQPLGNRFPHQLSGGQQQRVALARAIAIKPQVLLLDEPLSALDAKIRVELRHEIRSIQKQLGITTIYVTHDQEEAMSLSDRVVVMNEGRMEQVGTPFEIYNFPRTPFVASFVGTLNVLHGTLRADNGDVVLVAGASVRLSEPVLGKKAGEGVLLNLRPEAIVINGTASNSLPARVDQVNFLGSVVRMQLKVGDAKVLADSFNNPNLTLPQSGDAVRICFAPEACRVM